MTKQETFLEKIRKYRDQKFAPLTKFLVKIGLTANMTTSFSLLSGLIAVYFLFSSFWLFLIFALLHLLADNFDGLIARATKTSKFGEYFDYFTDRSITLLLLVRIAFNLQDYYVIIVIGLFLLTQLVYLISKLKAPVVFTRTVLLLLLIVPLSTLGYLSVGVISLYSLALQLRWFV